MMNHRHTSSKTTKTVIMLAPPFYTYLYRAGSIDGNRDKDPNKEEA